jgi:uncharacterized protein YciI
MPYFVVISEQGSRWVDSRPMREQELWKEHADFINSLRAPGFVILAGPIGSGHPHRALLIVHAESESAARAQLAEDPWVKAEMLRTASVEPWKILASNDKLDPVLEEITGAAPPN